VPEVTDLRHAGRRRMNSAHDDETESQQCGDSGTTLVDLLTSMIIMGVVMTMFTSAIIALQRSVRTTDSMAATLMQLQISFSRLDREIRYAESITSPSPQPDSAGNWYVEYLSTYQTPATCSQLRLSAAGGRPLQLRDWTAGGAPVSPWVNLAAGVLAAGKPFRVTSPGAGFRFQRLTVSFVATAPGSTTTRTLTTSFSALNSSAETLPSSDCSLYRSS
jgi:hypothetical protein